MQKAKTGQNVKTVYCDNKDCGNVFNIEMKKRKAGKHNSKPVHENYFACPKCGKEYTAFYQSKETYELNKKIKICQQRISELQGSGNYKEIEKLMTKIKKHKDKLKAIHKLYKLKYGNAPM